MSEDMGTASGGGDPADPSYSDIGGEGIDQGMQTGTEATEAGSTD